MLRYIKVFKDKATSKGNRYRPYYLLEHMDFLLPFIDERTIVRKVKPVVKSPQASASASSTVTLVKKDPNQEEAIIYTNATPSTITYNVVTASSKDSSSQELKADPSQQTQDIQHYYNTGVKIIGEDYITTYQPGEQLIYQATSTPNHDESQIQHQECIQEQHDQQQQDCIQEESPSKSQLGTTIIPLPNMSSVFSSTNPNEVIILIILIHLFLLNTIFFSNKIV